MSGRKRVFDLPGAQIVPAPRPASTTQALHQAAMGLNEQLRTKPKLKTRDLIGYLLGHGARAWRSSLPPASPAVRAITPAGRLAVKIRFN